MLCPLPHVHSRASSPDLFALHLLVFLLPGSPLATQFSQSVYLGTPLTALSTWRVFSLLYLYIETVLCCSHIQGEPFGPKLDHFTSLTSL